MSTERPLFTNRLIIEKSPYLLQHAHNPIDWYPWGEEAFTQAQAEDKPIFLSIGYATCHFCHVMEHESFENVEIAKLMNETFVNVKVDREELPQVDNLYMEFAQAMMSSGAGWPLNVILTSDLKPFFAATYLPPDSKQGFLGLKQLALRIAEIWKDREEREEVIAQAGKIVDLFADHMKIEGSQEIPTKEQIPQAAELLFKTADPLYGGTRGSPKFPIGYQACFLLRYAKKSSDSRALFYIERTLDMMHRGGIYDHLGFGFSRYSIDERWLVPHFEKMLYDNAILARAYLESWEFTHVHFYREVAEEIFAYVLRELVGEGGGFYSGEDADSEEREGRFYTWSWQEVHTVLQEDAPLFCEFFNVTPTGNFEGRNVLHMAYSIEEFALKHSVDPVLFLTKLREMKQKLYEMREKREHPLKDDKVITSWNGLMIYSFAQAGRAFHSDKYFTAAIKAASFIKENLWKNGTLYRRWREGEERFDACLDDYACLIHACLALFETGCGTSWLDFALELTHCVTRDFQDGAGGFYFTNGKDPHLLMRSSEFYDGAEPSGNAVHADNLLSLYEITGVKDFLTQAEGIFKAAKPHIEMYPPGACYHLMALQRYYDADAATLVIALNEEGTSRDEISKMLSGRFIPHKNVIWCPPNDPILRDLVPLTRDKPPIEGKTTLYLCKKNHCQPPITHIPDMWSVIEKL